MVAPGFRSPSLIKLTCLPSKIDAWLRLWCGVPNKIYHVYSTKGKGRGSLPSIIDGSTDLKDHKSQEISRMWRQCWDISLATNAHVCTLEEKGKKNSVKTGMQGLLRKQKWQQYPMIFSTLPRWTRRALTVNGFWHPKRSQKWCNSSNRSNIYMLTSQNVHRKGN